MKTGFTFKVDCDKLTGSTTTPQGGNPIKEGKKPQKWRFVTPYYG